MLERAVGAIEDAGRAWAEAERKAERHVPDSRASDASLASMSM